MSAAGGPEPHPRSRSSSRRTGWSWPDWRELWAHRELIYFLGRRDVAVRYKQSLIGALWAVVQPLLLAAVFSLFFGLLANIDTGTDVPYPVFALLGMVTWLFFASALAQGRDRARSTSAHADLEGLLPAPGHPARRVLAPVVDFAVGFVVALVVTLAYGVVPPVQVVLCPLLVPLAARGRARLRPVARRRCTSSTATSANVVPFVVLVGLFITPIVYPFSHVPEAYQLLYALNPMVGVLELMRWMVLPGSDFPAGAR